MTYHHLRASLGTIVLSLSLLAWLPANTVAEEAPQKDSRMVSAFPKKLQLYPRDLKTGNATIIVSGSASAPYTNITLNVNRNGTFWKRQQHDLSTAAAFEFEVAIPAELANYSFHLVSTDKVGNQEEFATAKKVVAGDVYVINGQSNAAAGIFEAIGVGRGDQHYFMRSFGGNAKDEWDDNDEWHFVIPECRPFSQYYGCVGRWAQRLGHELVTQELVPVAIINGARGGKPIEYFASNPADHADVETNYGRLLTRLEMAGVRKNIRAFMWYQGESDRTQAQAHMDGFKGLFEDWETDFPSVERTYIFQIRHTCVPKDLVTGQGSEISNFQREFANARDHVTPVSTTGMDGHNGCHFKYTGGYKTMGDNLSRMIRRDLYGQPLRNADAPDILSANRKTATSIELRFTKDNDLVADEGFDALFEITNADNKKTFTITGGSVADQRVVTLTTKEEIPYGAKVTISYHSPSGDQNWLTNHAGIGILTFLDFPLGPAHEK